MDYNKFTLIIAVIWWTFFSLYILTAIYFKLTLRVYKGKEKLYGKTVVITGGNAGIGLQCTKNFAERGAKIILACRDVEKAERIRRSIISKVGNTDIKIKYIDFTSLTSVRKCANEILAEEERIDILLNNAGAGNADPVNTEDGLNPLMQANYFGPFLFTNILLGKIKKSQNARIVNVSSIAHFVARLDLNILKEGGTKNQIVLYANSKIGNIYFSNYLAELLKGTGVTVNSLHPGAVYTEIFRNTPFILRAVFNFVAQCTFKTAEQGAQTSIYLCLSPEVEGKTGGYYDNCKLGWSSQTSKDMAIAKKLWEKTESIVGLKETEKHYQSR